MKGLPSSATKQESSQVLCIARTYPPIMRATLVALTLGPFAHLLRQQRSSRINRLLGNVVEPARRRDRGEQPGNCTECYSIDPRRSMRRESRRQLWPELRGVLDGINGLTALPTQRESLSGNRSLSVPGPPRWRCK
jgi:hypothetical protein